jgi:2-polyprenyl-3-methyl-5-hydroxy-6-metoxy-1,4-benzoquinol methylase
MSFNTIEKTINPWEYMCERWSLFAPPGRPSKQDVENFKKLLYRSFSQKSNEQFNVLVLGATPEIRDMLAEDKRISVTLVDITFDMLISMTHLMKNKNPNEIRVKANWLTVPLKEGYFDAVLSDLVICNVAAGDHNQFYRKILELMKPDGHWINRVYVIDKNTQIRTLDQLLEQYSQKETITKEDINNFRSTAGLIAWNREEKLLDWSLLLEEMEKYYINGKFVHSSPKVETILEGTYELFKPFDKKYFLDTEEGTETELKLYFRIIDRILDDSVVHLKEKAYYLYDLTKK